MKRIQDLKLFELIIVYIGLFGLYVVSPYPTLKHIVAPTMLLVIVITFLNSLQYLNRR